MLTRLAQHYIIFITLLGWILIYEYNLAGPPKILFSGLAAGEAVAVEVTTMKRLLLILALIGALIVTSGKRCCSVYSICYCYYTRLSMY